MMGLHQTAKRHVDQKGRKPDWDQEQGLNFFKYSQVDEKQSHQPHHRLPPPDVQKSGLVDDFVQHFDYLIHGVTFLQKNRLYNGFKKRKTSWIMGDILRARGRPLCKCRRAVRRVEIMVTGAIDVCGPNAAGGPAVSQGAGRIPAPLRTHLPGYSILTNTASPSTFWPSSQLTSTTLPVAVEATGISIFIASKITTGSSSWTVSPTLTFTSITFPGMGAVTSAISADSFLRLCARV
jgi:hypothetical protein